MGWRPDGTYVPDDTHTSLDQAQTDAFNKAGAVTSGNGNGSSSGGGSAAGQGWITAPNGQTYLVGDNNRDQANVDTLAARTYGYQNQQQNIANALGGTANGAGVRGQYRNAGALEAFANAPTGPSAAELAMRQQSGQAMQQNLAMASSGTGASGNALMLNAMNRNAMQQGGLAQALGVQRAQEAQAIRAQQMAALQASGQLYGHATGAQQAAYAGQGQIMGNVAGQNQQLAGLYGQIGMDNAHNALQAQQLKQQQDAADRAQFNQYLSAGIQGGSALMSGGATLAASAAANQAQSGGNDAWGKGWGKASQYGYTGEGMTY